MANKKTPALKNAPGENVKNVLGKSRSFAMSEAHKRLRTNIFFSFSGEKSCRVIGVTSAMAHEGKSTTSINLAYDIMQAGKRVLLVDADMRLSRISKLLDVRRSPGLSNMLVGNNNGENIIQKSIIHDGLPVVTCGDPPPNPTELLASKRMEILLDALKGMFEYIIIDLPPVAEVSDPLIVSKLTDGMVIVVRQDYADRKLLDDSINQLRFNEANIIGFVLTCSGNQNKKYYKKQYKGYNGKKYGYYHHYAERYAESIDLNFDPPKE